MDISSIKNKNGEHHCSHFKRVDLGLNFGLETEMPQHAKALAIQEYKPEKLRSISITQVKAEKRSDSTSCPLTCAHVL